MGAFESGFASADLWSRAINQPGHRNRMWDCERLVPAETYENSAIYNEWIRPMGDDTFRAIGGVIQLGSIIGEVGFHRGKGQPAFSDDDVRIVEGQFRHLGRLFSIRNRLGQAAALKVNLQATLDMVGDAIFTLHATGRLIHHNQAADLIVRRGDGLSLHRQRLRAGSPTDDHALQAALKRAVAPEGGEAGALFLSRPEGPPYCLSIAPVRVGSDWQIVVVITDPDAQDASLVSRLRSLYGLTKAEAEVTERLCTGASLERVSEERGVVRDTLRTQLKAIYGKLDCNRLPELIAKVGRLSTLGRIS